MPERLLNVCERLLDERGVIDLLGEIALGSAESAQLDAEEPSGAGNYQPNAEQ